MLQNLRFLIYSNDFKTNHISFLIEYSIINWLKCHPFIRNFGMMFKFIVTFITLQLTG